MLAMTLYPDIMRRAQEQLDKVSNQARFIQMIVDKELVISGRKKVDVVAELRKKNFRPFPKAKKIKAAGETDEIQDDDEEEAERDPFTYEAPEIPNDIPALRAGMKDAGETEEISEQMRRLMRQTGLDLRTIRSFKTKELVRHRVVNQTKMGKIARIYTLTIAGDGKGMLGL